MKHWSGSFRESICRPLLTPPELRWKLCHSQPQCSKTRLRDRENIPTSCLKINILSKPTQLLSLPLCFIFACLEESPLKGLWQFARLGAISMESLADLGNTQGTPGHSHGPGWRALHTPAQSSTGFEHNLRAPLSALTDLTPSHSSSSSSQPSQLQMCSCAVPPLPPAYPPLTSFF